LRVIFTFITAVLLTLEMGFLHSIKEPNRNAIKKVLS
jgi:hypothetical protein